MDWIKSVFVDHTPVQAVIILSLIIAAGLGLGKLSVKGVTLGVTWVFFVGILFGHLGFSIDDSMLVYAESFGLVLFVYELGLKVGPGFFSSFRKGGVRLNLLGLVTVGHHQPPGARSGATGAAADGSVGQRGRAELRGDVSARSRGRDSRHDRGAEAVRASGRHIRGRA